MVNVSFPRAKGEPRVVGVDAAPGHPGYFSDTDLRDLLKQAVELVKTEPHRVCINTPNMRTAAAREVLRSLGAKQLKRKLLARKQVLRKHNVDVQTVVEQENALQVKLDQKQVMQAAYWRNAIVRKPYLTMWKELLERFTQNNLRWLKQTKRKPKRDRDRSKKRKRTRKRRRTRRK